MKSYFEKVTIKVLTAIKQKIYPFFSHSFVRSVESQVQILPISRSQPFNSLKPTECNAKNSELVLMISLLAQMNGYKRQYLTLYITYNACLASHTVQCRRINKIPPRFAIIAISYVYYHSLKRRYSNSICLLSSVITSKIC